jgi:hypothetical protein
MLTQMVGHESALKVLTKGVSFRHFLLLLIFGLEARSDERRILMLYIIAQTAKYPGSRNIPLLLTILQSAWN